MAGTINKPRKPRPSLPQAIEEARASLEVEDLTGPDPFETVREPSPARPFKLG